MKAPFIYFFENASDVPEEFSGRFQRGNVSIMQLATGPEGRKGLLVAPFSESECKYDPQTHHWEKVGEGAWLGAQKKVDPNLFLRDKTFAGYLVTLADGQEWRVPVANPFVKTCTLPIIYRWRWCDKAKKTQMYNAIENRFAEVSEKAGEIGLEVYERKLDALLNGKANDFEIDMPDEEAAKFLHKVISVNYDINFLEFQALGVFSIESFERMFSCLIDTDGIDKAVADTLQSTIEEKVLSKKNSSSDSGEPVSSPTTSQQLQTSFFN